MNDNVIKMRMSVNDWNYVCEICERLRIDPLPYQEVWNYGKLIFDLTKLDLTGRQEVISPNPADYNKGGKYGN